MLKPTKDSNDAKNHEYRARFRRALWAGPLLAGIGFSIFGGVIGCARSYYRHGADREVFSLIDEKARDAGSSQVRRVQVDNRSRMFDPFNPDRPPMPEDDPTSHRYMEVIDGKKHYPLWDINGRTNTAENPQWWECLPLDDRGVLVLNADTSVQLALLHSTAYQNAVETLYLSALDVSSERFLFDTQFFAGRSLTLTTDGPDSSTVGGDSSSTVGTGFFSRGRRPIAIQRRFSTGADLVVGLANSITWQLSGPNTQSASTLLDFSFVQPLLRQGGRDVVLERLTLAERTLLANVRTYERYRRGFYLQVVIGRNGDQAPSRRGGLFGGAGLEGFTGLGGGFGQVGTNINNANAGGNNNALGGGGAVPQAGGFLGLLQSQLNIKNLEENVASQRDVVLNFDDALREMLTKVQITQTDIPSQRLQVAQSRQALFGSQATLLNQKAAYEQTLDQFKQTLGLPPYLCVEITDPLLDQFKLIGQDLLDRRTEVAILRDSVGRENSKLIEQSQLERNAESGETFRSMVIDHEVRNTLSILRRQVASFEQVQSNFVQRDLPQIELDLAKMQQGIGGRIGRLERLKEIYDEQKEQICTLLPIGFIDDKLFDTSAVRELPETLGSEYKRILAHIDGYPSRIKQLETDLEQLIMGRTDSDSRKQFDTVRDKAILQSQEILSSMAEDVLALQVLQARARTESIILPEVDLGIRDAVEIARANRHDWMNARASLVDAWRAIELVADDLESYLDFVFSGDLQNINDNPWSLRSSTGRLRAGLQWDTPLTRLQERNRYRQVLIEYQQAKRTYYRYEDNVWTTLRSQLRQIAAGQINFELQRYAVRTAAEQATLNQDLRLIRSSTGAPSSPTEARDSISALNDLLTAQNNFLGVWAYYEVLRRNLDQDLGTMQLDPSGLWVDPGPITLSSLGMNQEQVPENVYRQLPPDLRREVDNVNSVEPAR